MKEDHLLKILLISLLLFLSTLYSNANDGRIYGEGGRVSRIKGNNSSVKMESETVKIDIFKNTYTVQAEFIFKNYGKSHTEMIGFPESGGGADFTLPKKSSFLKFQSWVNGKLIKTTRKMAHNNEAGYSSFWVKSVDFKNGEIKKIKVQYTSIPGDSSSGENLVVYNFTGGNWKGKVNKSELLLKFHNPGKTIYSIYISKENKPKNELLNGYHHFLWKNWEAEENFLVGYISTYPKSRFFNSQNIPTLQSRQYSVFIHGKITNVDSLPDIVSVNNVSYISALSIIKRLPESSKFKMNTKKGQFTFNHNKKKVTFVIRKNKFLMNGKSYKMKHVPFMSVISSDSANIYGINQYLYIPLDSALKALNGNVKNDKKNGLVFSFPGMIIEK